MIDSRSDGLLNHDLARLRREWVVACQAWTQVAEDRALTSTRLTDEQRFAATVPSKPPTSRDFA